MKRLFSGFLVVLLLLGCAGMAQAVENAWKTAKIGDWSKAKSTQEVIGFGAGK